MPHLMSEEEVRARVELRALVDEYAWRTDQYDYEGYADLFTPDGVVTAVNPGEAEPFLRMAGRADLVNVVHGNDQFVKTFHAVENHRCTVTGDTATGVTYCTAHHLLTEGSRAQTLVMLIRYHDEYARTDAGWRFTSRRLEFAWVEYLDSDSSAYPFRQGSDDWIAEVG
jgi:hypothetical protein